MTYFWWPILYHVPASISSRFAENIAAFDFYDLMSGIEDGAGRVTALFDEFNLLAQCATDHHYAAITCCQPLFRMESDCPLPRLSLEIARRFAPFFVGHVEPGLAAKIQLHMPLRLIFFEPAEGYDDDVFIIDWHRETDDVKSTGPEIGIRRALLAGKPALEHTLHPAPVGVIADIGFLDPVFDSFELPRIVDGRPVIRQLVAAERDMQPVDMERIEHIFPVL